MNLRNSIKVLATTLSVFASAMLPGVAHAAGSASYSLSPSGGSYSNGKKFTVTVSESSAQPVNTVEADLTYDAAKLQFVSVSTAGSPFSTCTQSSGGGGSVNIVCTALGGAVTGKQKVGSITFKALSSSGAGSVTMAQSSMIVSSESNTDVWNHAGVSGSYKLTAPVAAAPAPAPVTAAPAPTPVLAETTPEGSTAAPTPVTEPKPANHLWRNTAIAAGILALAALAVMGARRFVPALKSVKKSAAASVAASGPSVVKKTKRHSASKR